MKQLPDEEWQFPATLNSLTSLGSVLHRYLAGFPVDESWIYLLDLALCEAASNIIRHGYADQKEAGYRVIFSHDAAAITIVLIDQGLPVPAALLSSRRPDEEESVTSSGLENVSEGGRGIALIYACVDSISYRSDSGENQLTLSKTLPTKKD
ncbi:ATP-binding protein [Erwinia sp. 198]|uniref:ATP-binding protein n=1 Tax=Erwinia sp. 198 TaxID=2022746 RepID=UPI000F66830D|nr:ATP-binding protein [Erwinia sp. 198]RRZ92247.1 ATP-binding protein [Erwinia sp. 198]